MDVIIIALLLLLNGVFAMYEIALVSARKSSLEEEARSGRRGAKVALALLQEPERVLSAIQVGITLIGIVSGAYGGLALSGNVAELLEKVPYIGAYAQTVSVVVVVGIITYLSLIVGELVPKTIALQNAEAIATFLSPAMKVFAAITHPVVWVLSISTKGVVKFFGLDNQQETPVTEEELRLFLKKGSEHGVLEKEESEMIDEIFSFGDKHVGALMTPRVNVAWLDIRKSSEELLSQVMQTTFPRLPVCEDDLDNVLGLVNVKDLLASYIRHQALRPDELLQEPLYIPEQATALRVLELFRETKKHFGIVINEYGSVEGIVTLHDLTENIMGDLPTLEETDEPEVFQREDGSYLMDGAMKVEDVEDLLHVPSLFEGAKRPDLHTLSGLAMYYLNRIPIVGDRFSTGGYEFEIVDMDGKRVDKMLVKAATFDEPS